MSGRTERQRLARASAEPQLATSGKLRGGEIKLAAKGLYPLVNDTKKDVDRNEPLDLRHRLTPKGRWH